MAHPVGQTAGGHPLFAVGSVSLTLPNGARHFHRVLACSRCNAEIVEWDRAVDRPRALRSRTGERFCESCSQVPEESGSSGGGTLPQSPPAVGPESPRS